MGIHSNIVAYRYGFIYLLHQKKGGGKHKCDTYDRRGLGSRKASNSFKKRRCTRSHIPATAVDMIATVHNVGVIPKGKEYSQLVFHCITGVVSSLSIS